MSELKLSIAHAALGYFGLWRFGAVVPWRAIDGRDAWYHRIMPNAPHGLDIESMIMIVVGAHLRAEVDDRPLAQRLCETMRARIASSASQRRDSTLNPVICTDVWYLNNAELHERPVIAIGEPGVNAATAYFCNRLPTALMVENVFRVHLDPEFLEPRACLWGACSASTSAAIDVFVERYLDSFLREAMA